MTTADTIADALGNNGQQWTTTDGLRMDDLLARHDHQLWGNDSAGVSIAVFDDDSALLLTESFWDTLNGGRDGSGHRWLDGGRPHPEALLAQGDWDRPNEDWTGTWKAA